MSQVVRLPADVMTSAKQTGALEGRSAAEMVARAWYEYLETHRHEFAAGFEEAAALLREGDTEALAEFASRSVVERAADAADELRQRPPRK